MQSLALAFAASIAGRPPRPPRRSTVGARRDRPRRRQRQLAATEDLLGAQQHLGAHVLDRLEAADRLAELLAHLRVLGGGLQRPAGQPRGLGGQHGRGEVLDPLRAIRAAPRRVRSPARTRASGREKSVAFSGSTVTPSAVGVDQQRLRRRRAAAAPRRGSAPSTYSAVPDARPPSYRTSADAARRPAVRSPGRQRLEQLGMRTARSTSVASAVVATGPGTIAAAASSTIAHRSSTVPPAPPCSSGSATPKIPSCGQARRTAPATRRPRPAPRRARPRPRRTRLPSYGPVHARQTARR